MTIKTIETGPLKIGRERRMAGGHERQLLGLSLTQTSLSARLCSGAL
jgi:hypothetical protein